MKVVLPMPPSDNKIYFNRGKGRQLTRAAEKYQNQVREVMAELAFGGSEEFEVDVPYAITIYVYFKEVLNKGWPKSAKNRFKKQDCMNRQKLVTDCVMSCIGVDDSHVFDNRIIKRRDRENPRVEVVVRRM